MKTSIRDISRITGVSPATVSNALNYKKGVNQQAAEEIFRAARETGSAVVVLATEMLDEDLDPFRIAPCPVLVMDGWTDQMDFNAVLINTVGSAEIPLQNILHLF